MKNTYIPVKNKLHLLKKKNKYIYQALTVKKVGAFLMPKNK